MSLARLGCTRGSDYGVVKLWDLQGNIVVDFDRVISYSVRSVAFSPDGQIIATSGNSGKASLWNLEGNHIQEIQGSGPIAFSPDGQTIVSSAPIQKWDLEGNPVGDCLALADYKSIVWSTAFSPDGQTIISGCEDRTVRLWDLTDNSINNPFESYGYFSARSVAFSPDGKTIISGGDTGIFQLWDLQGNHIGQFRSSGVLGPLSVAFSPNGKNIVTSYGHDDEDTRPVAYDIGGIDMPSGKYAIEIWNLQEKTLRQTFQGHSASIWSAVFSPNGKNIASCSDDHTIRLWNLEGDLLKVFSGYSDSVRSVAFSPDGKTIIGGSDDHTIRLWDLEGNLLKVFSGHSGCVRSIAFSPDGKTVVSGSTDNTIRLWDLEGGRQIGAAFSGHVGSVRSVAFSPDGNMVVSGSDDTSIRLWDLQGHPIGDPYLGHSDSVRVVAFSPDGQIIVSSSADGTIRLWRGGTWRDWLALCCNRFRYHPLFKNADREPFISACRVCEEYVWSREEDGG